MTSFDRSLSNLQALIRATFIAFHIFLAGFAMGQSTPDDLAGLELWFAADEGVTIDGANKVSLWEDLSGNGHDASQAAGSLQPLWVEDELNGLPVVRMDGFNDFMTFSEVANARTVFWVIKEEAEATANFRSLLGHSTNFDFIRGGDFNIWHSDFSNGAILSGSTRVNFGDVDGEVTAMPEGFALISLTTTGDVTANQLTLERSFFDRVWHGEIAEIIIYNELLSEEDLDWVENYLADKYTPEFFVDDDVDVEYGFCDTTICAAPDFESYLWSTEESTPCISVNSEGVYTVTVADIFNRELTDSVSVSFAGNLEFGTEIVLCEDSTLTLDSQLPLADYQLEWQDGSDDSTFVITEAGEYFLQVTDSAGCTVVGPITTVAVDDFGSAVSLGSNFDLCAGDELSLQPDAYNVVSYLWSNDSTASSIQVLESGSYWVEAIDENGCMAQDTVLINIIGQQPVLAFDIEGHCLGQETTFESIGEILASQIWWVDGQQLSDEVFFEILFEAIGEYEVIFTGENEAGCTAEMDTTISVYPSPMAAFDHTLPCEDDEITVFSLSSIDEGNIDNYSWIIDGFAEEGFQVFTSFEQAGFVDIEHTVISDQGCFATAAGQMEILPKPGLEIFAENICLGDLTTFSIEVEDNGAGDLDDFVWNFGDETISFDPLPTHLYANDGEFEVMVQFTAENGCSSSATFDLVIHEEPHIDFIFETACEGNPVLIGAEIDYHSDSADSLQWTIAEGLSFENLEFNTITFPEQGLWQIELCVTTAAGCEAAESTELEVLPSPSPQIMADPLFGPAPLDVVFSTDEPGSTFGWDFGDFTSGLGEFVEHTYVETGTYTIFLTVTDGNGCYGTHFVEVLVDDLFPDLVVSDVLCTENQGFTQLSVLIENQSNFPVNAMDLRWWIGNDSPVSEIWEGEIMPGEFTIYVFSSSPNLGPTNYGFVCVEAIDLTVFGNDVTPENNTSCKALSVASGVEIFPPYPNPASETLNFNVNSDVGREVVINVFDAQGKLVIRANPHQLDVGFNGLSLNVAELNAGRYTLEIQWDSNSATETFMISREND